MSCSPTDEYRLLLVNEYTIEENWWQLGLKKLVKLRINLKKEKNVLPSLSLSLSLSLSYFVQALSSVRDTVTR